MNAIQVGLAGNSFTERRRQ